MMPPPTQTTRVALLEERSERIEAKLDVCSEILNGNGSPSKGLVSKVTRLDMRMGEMQRTQESANRRLGWLVGIAGSLLVGLVLHAVGLVAGLF